MKFSELKKQVPSVDFEKILENLINPARRNILKDKIKIRRVGYRHSLFSDKKDNVSFYLNLFSAPRLFATAAFPRHAQVAQRVAFWASALGVWGSTPPPANLVLLFLKHIFLCEMSRNPFFA